MTYQASSKDNEAANLSMIVSNSDGKDYTVGLSNMAVEASKMITLAFNEQKKQVIFNDNDRSNNTYQVNIERLSADGTTNTYTNDNVTQRNGSGAIINLEGWDGQTKPEIIIQSGTTTATTYLPIVIK